jgi:predicted transcriptional regulator
MKKMTETEQPISDITVGSIMQRDVLTAEDNWPLDQLARFLIDNGISGAPVTDENGVLKGVVSVTDIVRHDSMPYRESGETDTHDYYLYTLERQVAQEEAASFRFEVDSSVRVRDIMTPMIFEVSEDTGIQQAADMMIRGRIHRVFVTENKRILGVVTALDMLKIIRDLE